MINNKERQVIKLFVFGTLLKGESPRHARLPQDHAQSDRYTRQAPQTDRADQSTVVGPRFATPL